jgi:deoxyribonuclease V
MILAVDVNYDNSHAVAAGVAFDRWADPAPHSSYTSFIENVSSYVPGQFYKRELPCILQLLAEHDLKPDYILVDGYVYLDGCSKPGLGKYLYDALNGKTRVVGVAKNPFNSISDEYCLYRGVSSKPLYITCAGEALSRCKQMVASMHGKHRYPEMLRQVDRISRAQPQGRR